MSKHTHHQNKAEQIDNKAHGTPPFHYDPYKPSELVKPEDIQTKEAKKENSVYKWKG